MFTREELQKIIDRNQSSGLVISRTEYAKLARQCLAQMDVVDETRCFFSGSLSISKLIAALERLDALAAKENR